MDPNRDPVAQIIKKWSPIGIYVADLSLKVGAVLPQGLPGHGKGNPGTPQGDPTDPPGRPQRPAREFSGTERDAQGHSGDTPERPWGFKNN